MLKTNCGCEFPCLWGIQPGVDTKATLQKKLEPILSIATYSGEVAYTSTELAATSTVIPLDQELEDRFYAGFEINRNDLNLHVDLDYYFQPEVDSIEYISISAQAFRFVDDDFDIAFDAYENNDILSSLSLAGILKTYGTPSQILIRVDNNIAEPDSPDRFNIWLIYREYGTVAQFWGNADVSEEDISFCPEASFAKILLAKPENLPNLKAIVEEYTGPWDGNFPSLETAIGMDNQEFVDTFSQSLGICVQTPLDLWPY